MNFKKIGATLLAMSMAAALAVAPATASQAATVGGGNDEVVYTDSFANRDTSTNPLTTEESKVQASEDLARYNLPTTVTINPKKVVSIFNLKEYDDEDDYYYSTNQFSIYNYNNYLSATDANAKEYEGITDIKSSSSNLKITVKGREYFDDSVSTGYYFLDINAYAKKAGTYTISYSLTYYDNNKLQKEARSIKVIAKEYKPFTKVTFAGKSLWYDKNSASKYIYKTNNFTTKKSGKLVVKAAKGFKINKIEVGTYETKKETAAEIFNPDNEATTTETDDYTQTVTYTGSITSYKTKSDYNLKDDYGNSIYCKWKTVKSGKKVKLSNVIHDYSKANYSITTTTTNKYSGIVTTNKDTTKYNRRKGNTAPTIIRITYTDTRTGEVHQWTKTIDKLIKK